MNQPQAASISLYGDAEHPYRIKEFSSVYDHFFSIGLGWIYCTNYLNFKAAKIILKRKIKRAKGRPVVYIIDKPE